jgi:hypothetical protein
MVRFRLKILLRRVYPFPPLAILQEFSFALLCCLNALKRDDFHRLLTEDRSVWLVKVLANIK